ncbi:hypothetical protein OPKNFCMD_1052 [Methylobacterium crusticola]|uniref:ATP-binding cassette domain-containing protein n=1 Tax=Methylobacterium crusticola TaxID=1697972 RepID=A0ABQ4QUF4_9HYPH|nr:hypothetical protein [Methylobacterium crusticola]GJD48334.1 hypothetical protein OPKNFCMD_1052 [Methylobacterium crusticola]
MPDSRIEIARLAKDFRVDGRTLRALDGIDPAVAPGEFVTIVGASGCGKSETQAAPRAGAGPRPEAAGAPARRPAAALPLAARSA